jgi:predicted small lipoprotein YifL
MPTPTRPLLAALLALTTLAACGEKPQTLPQTEARAQNRDQTARNDELRQRALTQDESGRVHKDNVIR